MHTPRFFARGNDLKKLEVLSLAETLQGAELELAEDDLIKQLRCVLRLGRGHKILLLDGKGGCFQLQIERMEKTRALCRLVQFSIEATESRPISMAMAVIKAERFEWCIEKLTELGVATIIPLLTQNSVVKLGGAENKESAKIKARLQRWKAICREAAEQSERLTVPDIVSPLSLSEFLENSAVAMPCVAPNLKDSTSGGNYGLKFLCQERSKATPLVEALKSAISSSDTKIANGISIMIGPEGGFSSHEIATAQQHGFQPVSLGTRILRSETAAIAAMCQVASIVDI